MQSFPSGEPNLFAYIEDPLLWIDPLGLQRRTAVLLGGTGKAENPKPPKQTARLFEPPKNSPSSNPSIFEAYKKEQNAKQQWLQDTWSGVEDAVKNLEGASRIDESLACIKVRNIETMEERKPYDVMIDDNGVGIIRIPSPSEIEDGYECLKTMLRPLNGYSLPGL